MDARTALPVVDTCRETLRVAKRVLRAQEPALIATVMALLLLDRARVTDVPGLGALGLFVVLPLALLCHIEALRGGATLKDVVAKRGARFACYALDATLIALAGLAGLVAALMAIRPPPTPLGDIEALVIVYLVIPLATARLWLRLVAGATEKKSSWREVWARGRGNTLRLAASLWLVLLPLIPLGVLAGWALHDIWILEALAMNMLSALGVVGIACHISVCSLRLTRPRPRALLALPAPADSSSAG